MFVHDFVTIERPYAAVAGALANDRAAGALARAVLAAAARDSDGDAATETLRFEVGKARSVDGTVVVPIRWTPGTGGASFRHLEGSLHVEPNEPDGSYLSLSASCDEPPTGLGRREDRRRRQREAEMSVRAFLGEIVAALQSRDHPIDASPRPSASREPQS